MRNRKGNGVVRRTCAERWPVLGPCFGVLVGTMGAGYAVIEGDGVAATVFGGVALCLIVAGLHNHSVMKRSS
jgi:phosphotransferase system  glucose/maltose/N-acetylglucosamine-specific IIC component